LDRNHRLNFILTFVIGISFIVLGFVITIIFLDATFTPQQIVLGLLPPNPSLAMIEQMMVQLGLNQPLFIRLLRALGDFLVGNWGISSSIAVGAPVTELLRNSLPHTIEILMFPLIIGIILGYLFGRISNRTKYKFLKSGIQILSSVVLAIPIFLIGMFLQYTFSYLIPMFPAVGYKSVTFTGPPLITGFKVLDALLSLDPNLAFDIVLHYILPSIILLVAITALMTKLYSSSMVKDSYKRRTILSHTAKTSVAFIAIFTFVFLIDVTFNLSGFGISFVRAITHFDYFLIRGYMFAFIILYAATLIISNLAFSIWGLVKDKKQLPLKEPEEILEREPNLSAISDLKIYLKKIVRSPLTIIGLVASLILVFVSIFPELISGSTFAEATGLYIGAWEPPSPDHLLGTAKFGRDVLALTVYGIKDALIFGFGAIVIGLIGGLIFGLLASKFSRIGHTISMSITLMFYVFPGIILAMMLMGIFGINYGLLLFTAGFLLIPSFTRVIANTEFRIVPIGKKIISYLPLFAGFAILLYNTLGFLGFSDYTTIQIGRILSDGRSFLYFAPWAVFWPGFAFFIILISLFVLHEGLAKHSR